MKQQGALRAFQSRAPQPQRYAGINAVGRVPLLRASFTVRASPLR